MTRSYLRVAKVGGSLLDLPQLPTVLRTWFDGQPGTNVLVGGGGPLADFIRRADERFEIGETNSHQLCLRLMGVSAQLLAAVLPESMFVQRLGDLRHAIEGRLNDLLVLDVDEMMRAQDDISLRGLPKSWEVTSDSIAAYLARVLAADELVLFKSTTLPANIKREQASDAGLVDGYFARASADIGAIRCINLRSDPPFERPL